MYEYAEPKITARFWIAYNQCKYPTIANGTGSLSVFSLLHRSPATTETTAAAFKIDAPLDPRAHCFLGRRDWGALGLHFA